MQSTLRKAYKYKEPHSDAWDRVFGRSSVGCTTWLAKPQVEGLHKTQQVAQFRALIVFQFGRTLSIAGL